MNNSPHTNPLIFTSLTKSREQMLPPDWLPSKSACLTTGKFPNLFNFSDGKEKIYLVELNTFKEKAFYGLQKILLDNFSRNFYI